MATPASTPLTFPRVEAPVSAAECDELKKPAAHRKILKEIDRLLGLADVAMGDQSGGDAPNGERQAHPTGLISDEHEQSADAFHNDRDNCSEFRQWQIQACHIGDGAVEPAKLLQSTQQKNDAH